MVFFSLVFLALFLGDFFWCWKMHRRLRRFRRPWRRGLSVCVVLFAVVQACGLLVLFFGRRLDLLTESLFPEPLIAFIYIWHCLVLLPVLLIWFASGVAAGILRLGRMLARLGRPKPAEPSGEGVTRREFVAASAWAAPAVLALGGTGIAALQWDQFRVRQLTVQMRRLPKALDGLTIAQVCDLHVGVFTHGAVLNRIVEATNRLRADLVMLPGDLINYSLTDLPAALHVAKRLESKYGVFLCEGNHDLFENPEVFRTFTREAGLRLLVNESAVISVRDTAVQVLGLRWGAKEGDPRAMSSRGDQAIANSMEELLQQRNPDAFPILLAHHPHAFDYAENIPLTLAGHTHGGQLMLTKQIGFGPTMFRYWSGLYQRASGALVVSNGVGNWFPLRIQAPAEIVHLTLRSV